MKAASAPRKVLAGIPGWAARPATLSPLRGGVNNRSYLVESDGFQYVLRIASRETIVGGGGPDLESAIQQQAAAHGLAAPVLYSDAGRGVMLMEFLQGDTLTAEQLASPSTLQDIGVLLGQLHALPRCGVEFNPAAAADVYLSRLGNEHTELSHAERCAAIVRGTPPPRTRRCCHNDVVAGNLLRGNVLRLIDFEYACDNEPMFDLASLLCWHNLGARERGVLLKAYAGEVTAEAEARLAQQCRLFDALQWLWLASRQRQRAEPWAKAQLAVVRARLD